MMRLSLRAMFSAHSASDALKAPDTYDAPDAFDDFNRLMRHKRRRPMMRRMP